MLFPSLVSGQNVTSGWCIFMEKVCLFSSYFRFLYWKHFIPYFVTFRLKCIVLHSVRITVAFFLSFSFFFVSGFISAFMTRLVFRPQRGQLPSVFHAERKLFFLCSSQDQFQFIYTAAISMFEQFLQTSKEQVYSTLQVKHEYLFVLQ